MGYRINPRNILGTKPDGSVEYATRRTYQHCLLDVALATADEPEAGPQEYPYNVAYFDEDGSLWTEVCVMATSPEHAWEQVQATHADAYELHAATTAETE